MKRLMRELRKGTQEWVPAANVGNAGKNDKTRGLWAKAFIRQYVKDHADWDPEKCVAKIDPNPLLVYYMLYVAKWINRTVNPDLPVQQPLEFSTFAAYWREYKEKPLVHEGTTYKIVVRPPRYSMNACMICNINNIYCVIYFPGQVLLVKYVLVYFVVNVMLKPRTRETRSNT